ncbi:hypothetical protein G6F68_011690 [Rhizopus microsporus]|nr:hypothetical protein G6F68_011690 [Rhizopus microsporus]
MPADVGLALLDSARWQQQDWGQSNHRQNLSRVGGAPSWVQSAWYPACIDCGQDMPFVMQLDSTLPTTGESTLLWGSGGMLYTFCALAGGNRRPIDLVGANLGWHAFRHRPSRASSTLRMRAAVAIALVGVNLG